MKAPFGALFPTLAILAVGVAVWAGPDYAIAVPATVLGVAAAGLTIVDAIRRRPHRPTTAFRLPDRSDYGVREMLRSGAVGRAEIVALLDRVDREGDHPDLPLRTPAELGRLVSIPEPQFLEYVRSRLDALEEGV
jgi:hypothetical protein